MSITSECNSLNKLGEFSNHTLEEEFFQQDMQKSIKFIKPAVLILGILNALFIIPDYYLISDLNIFLVIAISKSVFLLPVLFFYTRINHIKSRTLANWLTFFEVTCSLLFLFVFDLYETPNYLIQAFGVMIIIISLFMIPNRWINMLVVSMFVSVGFIVMSNYFMDNVIPSEYFAGIVYLLLVNILCSIIAFRNHYYKRVQYINSKELERISTTDHLSRAYNRVKLDYELKHWVEHSRRYNKPLSLIIFDFDNFKVINDTFGHLIGDQVIVEAAHLTRENIREIDIFARWGGDEFLLLLPNTDKSSAVDLAERLRNTIQSHFMKGVVRVTCSFGVVEMSCDDGIENLLYKVDQMLYSAKKAGKNAVKVSEY